MDLKTALLLIIPAVIIILLIFPIFLEVRVSYNPLLNRGVVALFLFKKKIFYYFLEIHGKYIVLINDTETKQEELNFQSQKFAIIEEFMKQIKDKIRVKHFFVYYNIGTGDAFTSSLLCAVINQLLNFFFVNLKSRKPTASLCVYDTVSFNREIFEMAINTKISLSLFDLVYSLIYSCIIVKSKNWYYILCNMLHNTQIVVWYAKGVSNEKIWWL